MTRDEFIQHLKTICPEGTTELCLVRRGTFGFLAEALFQFGEESQPFLFNPDARDQCPDCETWEGGFHLPGCDLERCGLCGGKYSSCACERTLDKPPVPYIAWNAMCTRCGDPTPTMFRVPNEEWQHYIEPAHRGDVLCRHCYDIIREWVDTGPQQPKPTRFTR